jgi:hypothetical protein
MAKTQSGACEGVPAAVPASDLKRFLIIRMSLEENHGQSREILGAGFPVAANPLRQDGRW